MWDCNYLPFVGGWGVFHPGNFVSLLIWGFVIALIVYSIIKLFKLRVPKFSGPAQDGIDSLAILKARLAKGELSEDEFNRLKQMISEA
jgi:putative membrane protein